MKVPVDGTDLLGVNSRNRYGNMVAAEIAMLFGYDTEAKRRARDALAWFFAHGGNVDVRNNDGVSARWVTSTAHEQMVRRRGMNSSLEDTPMWDIVVLEDEHRKELGMNTCEFCGRGKKQTGLALLVCSRCKGAAYCGPPSKCQTNDWKVHKGKCKLYTPPRNTYLGVPLDDILG